MKYVRHSQLNHLFTFRRALTLVEMLTAIGVIGLLAALAIPVVQGSLNAARRASCGNNMRQIGIAMHAYQTKMNVLPSPFGMPDHDRITNAFPKEFSVYTQILPELDQTTLFNAINFDVRTEDPYLFPGDGPGSNPNATVMGVSLGMLLCPADGGNGDPGSTAGVNYRVNIGTERWLSLKDTLQGGPLSSSRTMSLASITDGLSNTVAFSEKLRGRASDTWFIQRTDMMIGTRIGLPYTTDESLAFCASQVGTPFGFYPTAGLTWFVGALSQTMYNHIIEPNSIYVDCIGPANPVVGIFGARSNHPGGVQALFANGSVRFVNGTVNRQHWRALGTRSGGEVVNAE